MEFGHVLTVSTPLRSAYSTSLGVIELPVSSVVWHIAPIELVAIELV